jgi:hypothetical protein
LLTSYDTAGWHANIHCPEAATFAKPMDTQAWNNQLSITHKFHPDHDAQLDVS